MATEFRFVERPVWSKSEKLHQSACPKSYFVPCVNSIQNKFTNRDHREMLDRLFGQLPQMIDKLIESSLKIHPFNAVALVCVCPRLSIQHSSSVTVPPHCYMYPLTLLAPRAQFVVLDKWIGVSTESAKTIFGSTLGTRQVSS